jgi:hypothetical protein
MPRANLKAAALAAHYAAPGLTSTRSVKGLADAPVNASVPLLPTALPLPYLPTAPTYLLPTLLPTASVPGCGGVSACRRARRNGVGGVVIGSVG